MGDETTGGVNATSEGTTNSETGSAATEQSESKVGQPVDQIVDKISRKFKVKIDGTEQEVDENELISGYQLRKASDQKLNEANYARKQAIALLQMLKSDPSKVLTDPRIGIDLDKFAEDIIYKKLQNEMMTPEQRELAEYKQYKMQNEALLKQKQEEEERKVLEEKFNQSRDSYVKDISEALTNAGIKVNDYTAGRVVHEMTKAIKAGFANVSAKDVIDLVHAQLIKDTRDLYGSSSEETLYKLLGDDVANKIRKYDVEAYKKKNAIPKSTNIKGKGAPTNTPSRKEKPLTPSELRAKIESEYGIG